MVTRWGINFYHPAVFDRPIILRKTDFICYIFMTLFLHIANADSI